MVWYCDCDCACGLCEGGDCECECHDLDILSDDQLISLIVKYTKKTNMEVRHLSRNHLYKTIRHTEPEKILKAGYKIVSQIIGDDDDLPANLSMRQIDEIAKRGTPTPRQSKTTNTPSPKKTIAKKQSAKKQPVKKKQQAKKKQRAKKKQAANKKQPAKKSAATKKTAKARALARCQT